MRFISEKHQKETFKQTDKEVRRSAHGPLAAYTIKLEAKFQSVDVNC